MYIHFLFINFPTFTPQISTIFKGFCNENEKKQPNKTRSRTVRGNCN